MSAVSRAAARIRKSNTASEIAPAAIIPPPSPTPDVPTEPNSPSDDASRSLKRRRSLEASDADQPQTRTNTPVIDTPETTVSSGAGPMVVDDDDIPIHAPEVVAPADDTHLPALPATPVRVTLIPRRFASPSPPPPAITYAAAVEQPIIGNADENIASGAELYVAAWDPASILPISFTHPGPEGFQRPPGFHAGLFDNVHPTTILNWRLMAQTTACVVVYFWYNMFQTNPAWILENVGPLLAAMLDIPTPLISKARPAAETSFMRQFAGPFVYLISGITPETASYLTRQCVWSAKSGITFFASTIDAVESSHFGAWSDLDYTDTPANAAAVVGFVMAALTQNAAFPALLQKYHDNIPSHITSIAGRTNFVIASITTSFTITHKRRNGLPPAAVKLWNVYGTSPTKSVAGFAAFREILSKIELDTHDVHGYGKFYTITMVCNACRASDHHSTSCPFKSFPGWNGPDLDITDTAKATLGAEHIHLANENRSTATTRGRGRGGRGRGIKV